MLLQEIHGGIGGFAVWNDGTITESHTEVTVEGASGVIIHEVGGLVGNNNGGTITASHATGDLEGNNTVGGLVGYNDGGTITASYATGDVDGAGNSSRRPRGVVMSDGVPRSRHPMLPGGVTGDYIMSAASWGGNYGGTITASHATTGTVTGNRF